MIAVVEYGSNEDREPFVLQGSDQAGDAIKLAAMNVLISIGDEHEVPFPNERTPESAAAWWRAMWNETTSPMITLFLDSEVFHV
ncbi:hypothetical protein ACFVH6_25575 [Spirillospora sp. NPDC127200]